MVCNHHGIVHEWGFNEAHEFTAVKFICKNCGEIRDERFPTEEPMSMIEHDATCDGTCAMCRSRKILMNTGDAKSTQNISSKSWNNELKAYEDARAQGIQPAGTSMKAIREATAASEAMGTPYSADTAGVSANKITKQTASKLKEVGLV